MKLIIDFDSFIYKACVACETLTEVKPNIYVQAYDTRKGAEYFKNIMDTMLVITNCNDYVICLSDWRNFRKKVCPTYKSNRKAKKPVVFSQLKDMVFDMFTTYTRPYLEADDLCRYLYEKEPNASIIASIDKDMATFPCKLFNPDKLGEGVRTISPKTANTNFMRQLIMGDDTDGYEGIKGMGVARTEKVLSTMQTIDEVKALYSENGYTEEQFAMVYNQARILGKNEILEDSLVLYGDKTWLIPNE